MRADTKAAIGFAALCAIMAMAWIVTLHAWDLLDQERRLTIEALRARAELAESRMVPGAEVMDLVREATGAAVGTQKLLEAIERRCE